LGKLWKDKLSFECFNVFYESQIILSPLKSFKKSKYFFIKKLVKFLWNSFNYFKTYSKINSSSLELKLIENIGEIDNLSRIKKKWNNTYSDLVSLCLDADYLKWRIYNNPKCSYDSFIILDRRGVEVGFAICNVTNAEIYIVELIVLEEKNISESLKSILKRYHDSIESISISYLGNIINPYNNLIFKALEKMGGKTNEIKDMKFVLRNISKKDIKLEISKFTLNGLWTEGFKI
jgi:hypothetical protein